MSSMLSSHCLKPPLSSSSPHPSLLLSLCRSFSLSLSLSPSLSIKCKHHPLTRSYPSPSLLSPSSRSFITHSSCCPFFSSSKRFFSAEANDSSSSPSPSTSSSSSPSSSSTSSPEEDEAFLFGMVKETAQRLVSEFERLKAEGKGKEGGKKGESVAGEKEEELLGALREIGSSSDKGRMSPTALQLFDELVEELMAEGEEEEREVRIVATAVKEEARLKGLSEEQFKALSEKERSDMLKKVIGDLYDLDDEVTAPGEKKEGGGGKGETKAGEGKEEEKKYVVTEGMTAAERADVRAKRKAQILAQLRSPSFQRQRLEERERLREGREKRLVERVQAQWKLGEQDELDSEDIERYLLRQEMRGPDGQLPEAARFPPPPSMELYEEMKLTEKFGRDEKEEEEEAQDRVEEEEDTEEARRLTAEMEKEEGKEGPEAKERLASLHERMEALQARMSARWERRRVRAPFSPFRLSRSFKQGLYAEQRGVEFYAFMRPRAGESREEYVKARREGLEALFDSMDGPAMAMQEEWARTAQQKFLATLELIADGAPNFKDPEWGVYLIQPNLFIKWTWPKEWVEREKEIHHVPNPVVPRTFTPHPAEEGTLSQLLPLYQRRERASTFSDYQYNRSLFREKMRDVRRLYQKEWEAAQRMKKQAIKYEWIKVQREKRERALLKEQKKKEKALLVNQKEGEEEKERAARRDIWRRNRLVTAYLQRKQKAEEVAALLREARERWITSADQINDSLFAAEGKEVPRDLVGFWPPLPQAENDPAVIAARKIKHRRWDLKKMEEMYGLDEVEGTGEPITDRRGLEEKRAAVAREEARARGHHVPPAGPSASELRKREAEVERDQDPLYYVNSAAEQINFAVMNENDKKRALAEREGMMPHMEKSAAALDVIKEKIDKQILADEEYAIKGAEQRERVKQMIRDRRANPFAGKRTQYQQTNE